MGRARSLAAQSPALLISMLALVFSLGGGAAFAATHLSGRAPQKAVTFRKIHLINGWVSSQHQYDTGNPAVAKVNGVVYLAGSLHQASGTSEQFATLPRADRPTHNLYLPIYTFSGHEGTLQIDANGAAYLYDPGDGSAVNYSSLAGVSYPVNS